VSPGTLGKDAVSITRRRNDCFSLPSAREKVLGKKGFADALCAEPSLPSATLDKDFAECFRHSAKPAIPVVAPIGSMHVRISGAQSRQISASQNATFYGITLRACKVVINIEAFEVFKRDYLQKK
jgi:hypothetical protein